ISIHTDSVGIVFSNRRQKERLSWPRRSSLRQRRHWLYSYQSFLSKESHLTCSHHWHWLYLFHCLHRSLFLRHWCRCSHQTVSARHWKMTKKGDVIGSTVVLNVSKMAINTSLIGY